MVVLTCSTIFCFPTIWTTVEPRFTDTHLIGTPNYYGQFALSLWKESPRIFPKFIPLNTSEYVHPVNMDTIYAPSMPVLRGLDCSLKGSVQNSMTSLGHGTKFRTTTWCYLPLHSPEKKEKNVMLPRYNFPWFQWLFLFYKLDRFPEFPWPIQTLLFLVSSTSLFCVVSIFLDLEISYIV